MKNLSEVPAMPNAHHNLILENRSHLSLSGVTEVDCFDERVIRLYTSLGPLLIKGRQLHVDAVSLETGDMHISGDIWLLQYGEKNRNAPVPFFKKLLR